MILHVKHRVLKDIRSATEAALKSKDILSKEDFDKFVYVCTLLNLVISKLTEVQIRILMDIFPEVKNIFHVDRALGETVEVGIVSDEEQKEIAVGLEGMLKNFNDFRKCETVYSQQELLMPLYESLLRVTCLVGDFVVKKPSEK